MSEYDSNRIGSIGQTDMLVIGSGLAGIYTALCAAEHGMNVTLATRGRANATGSYYAQGGIAAALGADDTALLHEEDTLRVGRGLCSERAVELLTERGPYHVRRLRELGVRFEEGSGELALTLEAGHSRRRIAHAGGGGTGRVIMQALVECVKNESRIQVVDDAAAIALLSDGQNCWGAVTEAGTWFAKRTVLATGGLASLFSRSTNPPGSTGQGVSLAFRAGAAITDIEFIQFHPTALARDGIGDGYLISEAVRGEGAILRNGAGERFMTSVHPDAELAPRDELSRAIVNELTRTKTGAVYLHLDHLDATWVRERFSTIADQLKEFGLDLATDPIPVSPAAHYAMGGVQTDLNARTTVAGLYACGETACTGVHGANRLASNSLLECLVFAERAALADDSLPQAPADIIETSMVTVPATSRSNDGEKSSDHIADTVSEMLWRGAGVVRCAESLAPVGDLLSALDGGPGGVASVSHESLVAGLIGRAALARTESRGGHFRSDYPEENSVWRRHITQTLDAGIVDLEAAGQSL